MNTIGSKIKKLRLEKDMTQEELAVKAGIPYATLIKIEGGAVKNPTINTLQKLAQALEVSVDELLIKISNK